MTDIGGSEDGVVGTDFAGAGANILGRAIAQSNDEHAWDGYRRRR